MNREQRRKLKIKNKNDLQTQYLEEIKKQNKEFSKCADEVVRMYKQWVAMSFKSEEMFLKIINENEIDLQHEENEFVVMSYLYCKANGVPIGEPFVSNSKDVESVQNFKTDLGLIILHIVSMCENEKNVELLKERLKEINYKKYSQQNNGEWKIDNRKVEGVGFE